LRFFFQSLRSAAMAPSSRAKDYIAALQTAAEELQAAATAAAEGDEIEDDIGSDFLAYVTRHSARSDEFNFAELLQTVPKKEHESMWAQACAIVEPIVEQGLFVHDTEEDAAAPEAQQNRTSEELAAQCMDLLSGITTLATVFIADDKRTAPPSLLATASHLHSALFHLSGLEGAALQSSIAKLCEAWWCGERPGAEHLVACLLPYLLARSLDEGGREADIKRLWAVRGALLLLDWADPDCDSLRDWLCRACMSPLYLKSDTGAQH
jgi:hypothetical protein